MNVALLKRYTMLNKSTSLLEWSVCVVSLLLIPLIENNAQAGSFFFAGEQNGVDIITHPSGYTGAGGVLTVGVCIDSSSVNSTAMVKSVENMVNTFNKAKAYSPNLLFGTANTIPSNYIDFESLALHELGHCISLAHVNAASESGLSGANKNYTKATNGADDTFNTNAGLDAVIGSKDDLRGDDVNLHWFNKSTNNPCAFDNTVVDSSTYSRAVADLPNTDNFAANGDRDVCNALGAPDTEAIMQQGSFYDEDQRRLTQDGISTLKLGMSGLDEIAGTADDYTLNLVSHGVVVNPASNNSCDIIIDFDDTKTGLAVCQTGGSFITANHVRITSANMYFNTAYNWFFNDVLDSEQYCSRGPLVEGADFNLSNTTITDERRFKATQTITVGTAYEVSQKACLRVAATNKITLEPGFVVKGGGRFEAKIE